MATRRPLSILLIALVVSTNFSIKTNYYGNNVDTISLAESNHSGSIDKLKKATIKNKKLVKKATKKIGSIIDQAKSALKTKGKEGDSDDLSDEKIAKSLNDLKKVTKKIKKISKKGKKKLKEQSKSMKKKIKNSEKAKKKQKDQIDEQMEKINRIYKRILKIKREKMSSTLSKKKKRKMEFMIDRLSNAIERAENGGSRYRRGRRRRHRRPRRRRRHRGRHHSYYGRYPYNMYGKSFRNRKIPYRYLKKYARKHRRREGSEAFNYFPSTDPIRLSKTKKIPVLLVDPKVFMRHMKAFMSNDMKSEEKKELFRELKDADARANDENAAPEAHDQPSQGDYRQEQVPSNEAPAPAPESTSTFRKSDGGDGKSEWSREKNTADDRGAAQGAQINGPAEARRLKQLATLIYNNGLKH